MTLTMSMPKEMPQFFGCALNNADSYPYGRLLQMSASILVGDALCSGRVPISPSDLMPTMSMPMQRAHALSIHLACPPSLAAWMHAEAHACGGSLPLVHPLLPTGFPANVTSTRHAGIDFRVSNLPPFMSNSDLQATLVRAGFDAIKVVRGLSFVPSAVESEYRASAMHDACSAVVTIVPDKAGTLPPKEAVLEMEGGRKPRIRFSRVSYPALPLLTPAQAEHIRTGLMGPSQPAPSASASPPSQPAQDADLLARSVAAAQAVAAAAGRPRSQEQQPPSSSQQQQQPPRSEQQRQPQKQQQQPPRSQQQGPQQQQQQGATSAAVPSDMMTRSGGIAAAHAAAAQASVQQQQVDPQEFPSLHASVAAAAATSKAQARRSRWGPPVASSSPPMQAEASPQQGHAKQGRERDTPCDPLRLQEASFGGG